MSVSNKTFVFAKIPEEFPVPGEHIVIENKTFDPAAEAPADGITTENLYTSLDPYMRGRMRDAKIKSYAPAYDLGKPIPSYSIVKVLKSNNSRFKAGDIVRGMFPVQEYSTLAGAWLEGAIVINNAHNLDLRLYLGALGMPGLTAYSSLYEIGAPKKGEVLFVSSAAGPVGQLVGQLAKAEGLTVFGSVGSDEKLDFITKELGFDGGFNYKKEKAADALKRLAPNGIDIYYENVGGEQLQAALNALNEFGRIVVCGMISQYNKGPASQDPLYNPIQILTKRIKMQGFIVGDKGFADKYGKEHAERTSAWLAEGKIKAKTHETTGIENVGTGFVDMLNGGNFGKAVLKIKEVSFSSM